MSQLKNFGGPINLPVAERIQWISGYDWRLEKLKRNDVIGGRVLFPEEEPYRIVFPSKGPTAPPEVIGLEPRRHAPRGWVEVQIITERDPEKQG